MTPILLSPEMEALKTELVGYLQKINQATNVSIGEDGNEIAHHLTERTELQGYSPRMIELATKIYDWSKGKAAEEAMLSELVLKAKENLQRQWFAGKLSEANAMYEKTVMAIKMLDRTTEALRSLLSRDKELIRQSNFGGQP